MIHPVSPVATGRSSSAAMSTPDEAAPPTTTGDEHMDHPLFELACTTLGYDPERVISVRLNPRQAVITFVDSDGQLASATLDGSTEGPIADGRLQGRGGRGGKGRPG